MRRPWAQGCAAVRCRRGRSTPPRRQWAWPQFPGVRRAIGVTVGLELRAVQCVRGRRSLFKDLDLRLQPGQLLRLLGANGAGKTSLLRLICGLLDPAQGEVLWRGQRIGALREEYGRELVYLGHAGALKDDLTVMENLQAACLLAGLQVSTQEAAEALAQAGLRGRERAPARILSQGQRKRVALARLVLSPGAPLWVLDEPFNALDTAATAWLLELITRHVVGGGMVVLTSHQAVALPDSVTQLTVSL
jgi:heme exporter protein A